MDFKRYAPGLIIALVIGLIAHLFASLIPIGTVAWAIIIGLVFGNLFKFGGKFKSGIKLAETKILFLAIMLVGLQLEIIILKSLGLETLLFIILIVPTTIILGYFTGKLFGLNKNYSSLLGVGNGICGSSAIASTSPLIKADEEETGISIAAINFISTVGLFLLPLIALGIFGLSDFDTGVLIGGTIQSFGHVTAAGFAVNDSAGEISTVVKMGRILMLLPVLVFFSYFSRKKEKSNVKTKLTIPGFVTGFIIFFIIGNLGILPESLMVPLRWIGKELLVIAMAGIGLNIRFSSVVRKGPKILLVSGVIFILQILLTLGFIFYFLR